MHCRVWESARAAPSHASPHVSQFNDTSRMLLRRHVMQSAAVSNAHRQQEHRNSTVTEDDVELVEIASALPALQNLIPNANRKVFTDATLDSLRKDMDSLPADKRYVSSPDVILNAGTDHPIPVSRMTVHDASTLAGTAPSFPTSLLAGSTHSSESQSQSQTTPSGKTELPVNFDVRERFAAVARNWKVLSQGDCGSCWAVSAIDALAFQIAVAESTQNGGRAARIPNLSIRQLMGCSYDLANITRSSRPRFVPGMPTGTRIRSVNAIPARGREPAASLAANAIEQNRPNTAKIFETMDGAWGDYVENVATMVQTEGPPYDGLAFNAACWGGSPDRAWAYLIANGGVQDAEGADYLDYDGDIALLHQGSEDYQYEYPLPKTMNKDWQQRACVPGPYTLAPYAQNCKGENAANCFHITGEDNIKRYMVEHGPVQVVILNYRSIYMYKDGVYRSAKSELAGEIHCVVLCGWGVTDTNDKYWTIKNSYGAKWGNKGYGKIWARDPCLNARNRAVAMVGDKWFCADGEVGTKQCRRLTRPQDMVAWTARVLSVNRPTRSLFANIERSQKTRATTTAGGTADTNANVRASRQHSASESRVSSHTTTNMSSSPGISRVVDEFGNVGVLNAGTKALGYANSNYADNAGVQNASPSHNNGNAATANGGHYTNDAFANAGSDHNNGITGQNTNARFANRGNGNNGGQNSNRQPSNASNTNDTGRNANSNVSNHGNARNANGTPAANGNAGNGSGRNVNAQNSNVGTNAHGRNTNAVADNTGNNSGHAAEDGDVSSNTNAPTRSDNNGWSSNGNDVVFNNGAIGTFNANAERVNTGSNNGYANAMFANAGFAAMRDSGVDSPVFIQSLPTVPQYQVGQPSPMTPNNPTLAYISTSHGAGVACASVTDLQRRRGLCVPCLPPSSMIDIRVAELLASYSPFPCPSKGAGTWIGAGTQYINNFGPLINDDE